MARVKRAQLKKTRKKKLFERVKGFFGSRGTLLRQAHEAAMKADRFAFQGRRQKKSQFRAMWIVRINAALTPHDINYNRFVHGMKKAGITLDRKVLAELAQNDTAAFGAVVAQAKAALA